MKVFIYKYNRNSFGHTYKEYYVGFYSYGKPTDKDFYKYPEFKVTSRPKYIKTLKEFIKVYRLGMCVKFMTNKNYDRMVRSW